MATWIQYQRIEKDAEPFLIDSAMKNSMKINYRIQQPSKTLSSLGFTTIEQLHKMIEDVMVPAIAPHMNSLIEEAMNKKAAVALYSALNAYYMKTIKANPVTLFSGRVTKGRIKTNIHWLRVGKVFVLPAYQIFNGGLNVHLYFSCNIMKHFPADTVNSQDYYDRRDWAKTEAGYGPIPNTTAIRAAKNPEQFALALANNNNNKNKKKPILLRAVA